MNSAIEIFDTISAHGGQLWLVDGDRLRYRLPENLKPMVDVLREFKPQIVELLSQRPAMPVGVRLVSYVPITTPVRISQCETVMDIGRFVQSTLRQLAARLNGESGWRYGWRSLSELLARLAAVGCIVALDNEKAMLQ